MDGIILLTAFEGKGRGRGGTIRLVDNVRAGGWWLFEPCGRDIPCCGNIGCCTIDEDGSVCGDGR